MQGTDEARLNLNLDVRNGGKIVFDDEIDGGKAVSNQIEYDGYAYDINITRRRLSAMHDEQRHFQQPGQQRLRF